MEEQNYTDFTRIYRGTIAELHEGGLTVDVDDRLGRIMVPLRMVISDRPLAAGQTVIFRMSYIVQIEEEDRR